MHKTPKMLAIAFVAMLGNCQPVPASEVYECEGQGANGSTLYTDEPCAGGHAMFQDRDVNRVNVVDAYRAPRVHREPAHRGVNVTREYVYPTPAPAPVIQLHQNQSQQQYTGPRYVPNPDYKNGGRRLIPVW